MKKGKNIELLSPAHTNHLRCNKTIATQHCREKLQRPELPLCRSCSFGILLQVVTKWSHVVASCNSVHLRIIGED